MIIRNTRIIHLESGEISDPLDISVRNGTITATAAHLPSDGDEEIEASGYYALPGLVNTPAHTAMSLLRGAAEDVGPESWFNDHIWMYEKNLSPRDVYPGTLLGAAEMLLRGMWTPSLQTGRWLFAEGSFKPWISRPLSRKSNRYMKDLSLPTAAPPYNGTIHDNSLENLKIPFIYSFPKNIQ